MQLNLNADLGESFGPWKMGNDAALLDIVTTANVACGQHAGDPRVMQATVAQAREKGVEIGAHPGFPDLQGFGRRPMAMSGEELAAVVQYQIGALEAIARAGGASLSHVKPHGALNNLACEDRELADTVVSAIVASHPGVIILAPVFSELAASATAHGAPLALEVFADRAYTDSGHLVSRKLPGAVHESSEACVSQVQAMIEGCGVPTVAGNMLPTAFHSICVHGDNDHAVSTAREVRTALLDAGHELMPLTMLRL